MKIVKIDACNYEDNLFDDKSIIVNCTLDLDNDNEYKIRVMIDNDCIDYSFIDTNIAHKMCELLSIAFLKLIKSREVKSYDDRRDKDITHVIYSFMIIQNHIESFTFMMIIKLDQHLIILRKS
jgi:NMD protein affecting ribosome stability and mRNA decay